MAGKAPHGPAAAGSEGNFPETRSELLREAAAGNWDLFLQEYLPPCWREVVMACRARRITMPSAEDLFQELMLRLVRDSGFTRQIRTLMTEQSRDPDFQGNAPSRYLLYRQLPLRSAKFRTYLKGFVRNLVLEEARKMRRDPQQLSEEAWQALQPWIEQSVTHSLDRNWVSNCLAEAAWQLLTRSNKSPTRGRQRLFEIFYLSTVEGLSPGEIGDRIGLARTTASEQLSEAREQFAALLEQITGITDVAELKDLLAESVDDLCDALRRVKTDCTK